MARYFIGDIQGCHSAFMRLLQQVSRHFVCSSLSLMVTRSFDAVRLMTMAAIATVADATVRLRACDIPSMFSLHLDGAAPKTPR